MKKNNTLPLVVGILLCSPVHADDSETEKYWRLDEITVSATPLSPYQSLNANVIRGPIPIFETPQSIQVLNRKIIKDQGLNTLNDALENVSGVVPNDSSEVLLINPIARGMEAEIFIDGFMGYGDSAVIDPSSMISVESIEVLKGPTSLLYGGGTGAPVGGLINVVTKVPEVGNFAETGLRVGSYNTFAPYTDINFELSNRIKIRMPVEHYTSNDFIDEVKIKRISAAPSVDVSLSDTTDFLFQVNHSHIEQLEYVGLPFVVSKLPGVDPFQHGSASDAPDTTINNTSFKGTLSHVFTDGLEAKFTLKRYASDFNEFSSSPYLSFYTVSNASASQVKGIMEVDTVEWTTDASLTALIDFETVSHTLLTGVTYDHTNYKGANGFDLINTLGPYNYITQSPNLNYAVAPNITNRQENEYKTSAFYFQDQITIAEHLNILAGGRYSKYRFKEILGGQGAKKSYVKFDPRIGSSLTLTDGLSVFTGWAQGSRMSPFFSSADSEPPKLETSYSFDGGVKFEMNNHNLSGTVSGYKIVRENVPVTDPANTSKRIQTGKQKSIGVEMDLIWEPTPKVSFLMSAAYTDAKIISDTKYQKGNNLTRVPTYSGRLASRYRFPSKFSGLEIGAGLTVSSGAELTLENKYRSDSYQLVDVQASYTWDAYRLGLNIKNLFNQEYFKPYPYYNQDVVKPGAPLSVFLSLSATF